MQSKHGRHHFNFLSESFTLPREREDLREKMLSEPGSLWIVKPPGKNNGSGIYVINHPDEIPKTSGDETVLVQRYITNPYLIRRCKFDLRIYVLLTGLDPLKIYIYEEGLVRFAVNDFSLDPQQIKDNRIHVTNFDVNRKSDKFNFNNEDPTEPEGHKWTLTALWKYLSSEIKHGRNKNQVDLFTVWAKIEELVITKENYPHMVQTDNALSWPIMAMVIKVESIPRFSKGSPLYALTLPAPGGSRLQRGEEGVRKLTPGDPPLRTVTPSSPSSSTAPLPLPRPAPWSSLFAPCL